MYKYLGSIFDELNYEINTDRLCTVNQQILFFLLSLTIDKTLMTVSYTAYIAYVLMFSFICWFASLKVKKKALPQVVNNCSKVQGVKIHGLSDIFITQVLRKEIKLYLIYLIVFETHSKLRLEVLVQSPLS